MKHLAVVGLVFLAAFASADVTGKWVGGAILGPSKIAQTLDGDQLLKLHNSKEFMKTLVYELKFGADKTFTTLVRGEGLKERKGKGTWKQEGAALTINITEENGAKRAKTLLGTVSPDGTRFVVSIPSKPGLPITKLVFKKVG
ncbi:MAG TPA: hypothetical protein VK171_09195 [Fimbriimonas sp.]|nr:hypothetical protein [Fimbriimonas sp.]